MLDKYLDPPFMRYWRALLQSVLSGSLDDALLKVAKIQSVYHPRALRRKVRLLTKDELADVEADLWIDLLEARADAARTYVVGLIRWDRDDINGAIEAFRGATQSSDGRWALADALLWNGQLNEARQELQQIAEEPGTYTVFAKVLLDHQLHDKEASESDYRSAWQKADDIFGDGPSRRNFANAYIDFLMTHDHEALDEVMATEARRGNPGALKHRRLSER